MISHLRIFDLATGAASTLLTHEGHIEAPNWTPDGAALIVNGDGLIYRVDLSNPDLAQVDTGFAVRCNNDHGITADGQTLIISDSTEDRDSAIYHLPLIGGAPQRITAETPSYWHGVSPDGLTVTYVAKRGDDAQFDVFTAPMTGGSETRLTGGEGHHDGPEYTPDGAWIWFNSDRGGTMDLWRMRPDGSDLQQMTDDERVNWFPHISPDGAQVVYLAYENGVEGHPFGCEVQLRLMPGAGGAPRVLMDLYGGQGTINVPSWAPDSRRFAFVEYDRP